MAIYPSEEFKSKKGLTFTIRHCTTEDIDDFLTFRQQVASETTHTLQLVDRNPDKQKLAKMWEASIEIPVALRLGVFIDGRMVGHLSLYQDGLQDHPWTKHIARWGMMIIQECWGQGLGKKLMGIMEEHAKQQGIVRLEAFVRVENDRGMILYEKNGHKIEGVRKMAALINGQYQDEYYIAKILE